MVSKIDIFGNEEEIIVKKKKKRLFSRKAMAQIFIGLMNHLGIDCENEHSSEFQCKIWGNRIILKRGKETFLSCLFKENSRCDIIYSSGESMEDLIVTHYV